MKRTLSPRPGLSPGLSTARRAPRGAPRFPSRSGGGRPAPARTRRLLTARPGAYDHGFPPGVYRGAIAALALCASVACGVLAERLGHWAPQEPIVLFGWLAFLAFAGVACAAVAGMMRGGA